MVPAPWDAASPDEQLFVLVTGANSGIGLATGERLIDEFLETRPLTSHLVLLPTTRSASKALDTIAHLRRYALRAAQTSPSLRRRAGVGYSPTQTTSRIHILSLQVDLCDLRGIKEFAEKLCEEEVGNPEGLDGEYLKAVRVPRLDAVVLNAGFGGWTGFDLFGALWQIGTQGITRSVTWPKFKVPMPTRLLNEQPSYDYPAKPLLGEVFCACVFGHYVLTHELLPLLTRARGSKQPARIIWSSSIEAVDSAFVPSDIQALSNPVSYESAKRVTDLLALTASLPSTRPSSSTWLTPDDPEVAKAQPVSPKLYLTHPGVVASTFFPVPWFLFFAYRWILVVARWLGSPWHGQGSYYGAKSAAWVVLHPQDALDNLNAERIKWGSSCDFHLREDVKQTEVDGWGWEGKPVDAESVRADTGIGALHRGVGRHAALDTTEEDVKRFEELGAGCWREMERMRVQWGEIVEEKGALEEQINGKKR